MYAASLFGSWLNLGVRRSDTQNRYRSDTGIFCPDQGIGQTRPIQSKFCVLFCVIVKPNESTKTL